MAANTNNPSFVLLHISDLHISRLSWNPLNYVSKRAMGATNWYLRRKKHFPLSRQRALVQHLEQTNWDHLLISGDLVQLSLNSEFTLAKRILKPLLAHGPNKVTILPGNHDRYIPQQKPAFYQHFGDFFRSGNLPHSVATLPEKALLKPLAEGWWLLGLDSAEPVSSFSATGHLPSSLLSASAKTISTLPKGDRVIVSSHYPLFFTNGYHYNLLHDLDNLEEVKSWILAQPQVAMYLHGHIHENWVINNAREASHPHLLPLTVVNSAATTWVPAGKHALPASNYHRIVFADSEAIITPCSF